MLSKAGEQCHIDIPGIEAVYDPSTLTVKDVAADAENDNLVRVTGTVVTFAAEATDITVSDIDGRLMRAVGSASAVNLDCLAPGIYLIQATINGRHISAKVVR